jgi:hypothetical protein
MLRSFATLLILTLTGVCAYATGRTVDEDTNHQAMLKLVAEPLPGDAVAKHDPSFYGADNLYEYMDGGADIFVLYGVRALMHVDLRAKAVDVSVDLFDMGSADAAFGMYAAERSPEFRYLTIGAEGYQYQGMLNFLQDRYYVKLLGFGDGADGVLESLARAVSARIGNNPGFPAMLAKLPVENRKAHSEQYMPAAPLGHPFLGPAYVAAYGVGEYESKLLVTVARDEADAEKRLKELEEHFTKTGECRAAPELGDGGMLGKNSFEGVVVAARKGRYVVLLVNPGKDGEELVKQAMAGLE